MSKVLFPRFKSQHYYDMHYRFFENLAQAAGIEVEHVSDLKNYGASFQVVYRDKNILVDFYDFHELAEHAGEFDAVFKFHYYGHYPANVFPFTPISFYNWPRYFELASEIKYAAQGDLVLNNQVGYGTSRERRPAVKRILMSGWHYLDFAITEPEQYWRKAGDCLVSVHVPGAHPNILDRGQLQMMAFGACTISPHLTIVLPYCIALVPGHAYVECRPDYSDLIEKIKWCRDHRETCVRIGQNAKQIFNNYMTPHPAWKWIDKCLDILAPGDSVASLRNEAPILVETPSASK